MEVSSSCITPGEYCVVVVVGLLPIFFLDGITTHDTSRPLGWGHFLVANSVAIIYRIMDMIT